MIARIPNVTLCVVLVLAGLLVAIARAQLAVEPRSASPPGAIRVAPPPQPSASGANPASAGDVAGTAGAAAPLLAAAAQTVEGCTSISARIAQEINLCDQHLLGQGTYLQQRDQRHYRMRLEMRIRMGEETSSLVQVCDGEYLWTTRSLQESTSLTRIHVARVLQAMEDAKRTEPGNLGVVMSLGGLPKLLQGLRASFDFTTAERGRWGNLPQPVWRLRGQWKTEQLVKILPNQKDAIQQGKPPDLSKLASHLPDHVVLYLLAQDEPFPYRIEYRRHAERKGSSDNNAESTALVTMEFRDIDINAPIDPACFAYNPGDLQCTDQTNSVLEALGIKRPGAKR